MAAPSPDADLKAVERKIKSIKEVMSRPDIQEHQKESLRLMLNAALEKRDRMSDKYLESLLDLYPQPGQKAKKTSAEPVPGPSHRDTAGSDEVINVDLVEDSPEQARTVKKGSAKVKQVVRTEEKAEPKGSRQSKSRQSRLPRTPKPKAKAKTKDPDSPVIQVEDSPLPPTPPLDKTPRGRKRKKAAATPTPKTETPAKTPPAKKGGVKKISKVTGKGARPDVVWCSSESDADDPRKIPFTEAEHKAMYDTAREDVEAFKNSFKSELTKESKNAKRKKLFQKIKENVNSVGGNKRRKKYLYIHSQDHKSTSREAYRKLVKKYGASGAAGMPKDKGLTPSQIMCLEFWGVECAGWARQTKLDPADTDDEGSTVGSSDDAAEMEACEREQKRLRAAPKVEKEETSDDEDFLAEEAETYKVKSNKRPTLEAAKSTREEVERARKRQPARAVRTKKDQRATTNSEDDISDNEEPESQSPAQKARRGRGSRLPPLTESPEAIDTQYSQAAVTSPDSSLEPTPLRNAPRSSDRLRLKREQVDSGKKSIAATLEDLSWGNSSRRELDFSSQEVPETQDTLPEIGESAVGEDFSEDLDYSVHVGTGGDEVKKGVRHSIDLDEKKSKPGNQDQKKHPLSSTPKSPPRHEKYEALIFETPSTSKEVPTVNINRNLPSKRVNRGARALSTDEIAAIAARAAYEATEDDAFERDRKAAVAAQEAYDKEEGTGETRNNQKDENTEDVKREPTLFSKGRMDKAAEFIDQRIEDTVSTGFLSLKNDIDLHDKQSGVMHGEILGLRCDVQKMLSVPTEINTIRSNMESVRTDVSLIGSDAVKAQVALMGIEQQLVSSVTDIRNTKSHLSNIRQEMTQMKVDTQSMKGRCAQISSQTSDIKEDLSSTYDGLVNINTNVCTVNDTIQTVEATVGSCKSDINKMKMDVAACRTEVIALRHDVIGIKGSISKIEESLEVLKAGFLYRTVPEKIIIAEKEFKAEMMSPKPTAVPTSSADTTIAGMSTRVVGEVVQTEGDLETSEVTFNPKSTEATYEKNFEMFEDDVHDSNNEIADTQGEEESEETQDPTRVVLAPDTCTQDESQWPSQSDVKELASSGGFIPVLQEGLHGEAQGDTVSLVPVSNISKISKVSTGSEKSAQE